MVFCPVCNKQVKESLINEHIDSGCTDHILPQNDTPNPTRTHSFFTPTARKATTAATSVKNGNPASSPPAPPAATQRVERPKTPPANVGTKRSSDEAADGHANGDPHSPPTPKRKKKLRVLDHVAPLAERMRPTTLDDVYGQELVGPNGLLRGMLESKKLPSMVLWGKSGTGKTTIARLIANQSGSRFVEINSTSTKLDEVRKIFAEALKDLQLTGRRTIVFCDEIHRFTKTQQDAFLGPVEAGQITLIAATTENPSFKVINALLSRCRTFTLVDLSENDLVKILERAMEAENCASPLLDAEMLRYFASFSDGDARTALNLLELAMGLSANPSITKDGIKKRLTKTLVYDRAGDQHYDSISALHKSIRGSNADAALYYLARMLESGEDPRYIARRLIVVASEDVGLADNSMLSLATATYAACEKIGLPECRINLAHAVVALSLSPKSTRAYRGLNAAMAALKEPGVASLPIPFHLRNAPTALMKEIGYGDGYKYNPDYLDGRVKQEYLPEKIRGRKFLEDVDLGTVVDEDLLDEDTLRPELDD
ncbi:P-loop containing nucleoside triphosphate hydrolase protein [Trematosphaeria pertusa]|uniref:P-loop containing nucleoside triphosphate hydrolase protein n=1 Tax=Trematosphaeria pertusa TaxID=390896 RepID=A0A6A6J3M0_9PLEO|nr:P-loop containing nucleoside triphosphate hydrolase protein [Trematosphaeria pertusa]KAF2257001.1 P-loop containing nucleoside triphosphate hydrolase protein [Trematosphaeria pertusa]